MNNLDILNKKKLLTDLRYDLYGKYGFYYYVPMAESYTVQIPVTVSCSYNKCLYCDLNSNKKFKELSLDEIEQNIIKLKTLSELRKNNNARFLLAGGNPFVLSTNKLLNIAELIKKYFDNFNYISCFARADDILRKSDEDLRILKAAGYDRLCIGLESGSDKVLEFQQKGVTREDNLNAMRRLDEANIKYSGYIMLGLGGRDLSAEHVEQTSSMLNLARPFELTVVTLVLFKGAKLIEKVKSHEFKRMSPYETLKEGRRLLNNLNINVIWNATHKTNLYPVKGKLPEHKDLLLRRIDEVINSLSDKNNLKQYELKRWQNWSVDPGQGRGPRAHL